MPWPLVWEALQRQEALKINMRLEFCHQMRGMRKRQALVRICQDEAAELSAHVPITVHRASVHLSLRFDDWKGAGSPTLDERAAFTLCDELRDWYGVPPTLDMAAIEESAERNVLLVRLEVFGKWLLRYVKAAKPILRRGGLEFADF